MKILKQFLFFFLITVIFACQDKETVLILKPFPNNNSKEMVANLKEMEEILKKEIIPKVSPAKKAEFKKMLKTIKAAQQNANSFFKNPHQISELTKMNTDIALFYAGLHTDDFDVQVQIPSLLLIASVALESFENKDSHLYQEKSLKSAHDLVKRFPNQGRAYGTLAHILYSTNSENKDKCLKLYQRCFELDEDAEYCKEAYHTIKSGTADFKEK
jgi:hypothetical protein